MIATGTHCQRARLGVVWALVLAVSACGCGVSGSQGDCTGGGVQGGIHLTVTNAEGAQVCDATVTGSMGAVHSALLLCQSVDASCSYCQAGGPPGSWVLDVTAPGYQGAQTTVTLAGNSCGLVEQVSYLAVQLNAACANPSTHDNGLGQQWTDCTSLHTYSQAEATAACESSSQSSVYTCPNAVSCDTDAGSQEAVCSGTLGGAPIGPCDCWAYGGPAVGHVHVSDAGCVCAAETDPSWN